MQNTWLSLLPPLIVLAIAFFTRRIIPALVAGILAAAFIATDFSPYQTALTAGSSLLERLADIDNIYTYTFLFVISIIIVLISHTGGASAFATIITKRLKTARAAETASLLLSLTLFIDDYLNCLTVGAVMQPLTDRFSIPRAKLAYLIHSLTGPFVILAPISSWAAMITIQLDQAGVTLDMANNPKVLADPFYSYLSAIPFIFYSLILIPSVWFMVRKKLSFGPMYAHEHTAQTTGNLFNGKDPIVHELHNQPTQQGSLADLLVPLVTLVSCVMIGVPLSGGYWALGGHHNLIQSFKHSQIFLVLCLSSGITLVISTAFAFFRKKLTIKATPGIAKSGIMLMLPAVVTVLLASTLGALLRDNLMTGHYLASLLLGSVSVSLLPFIVYIVSAITSLTTGSAWGTIAIMLPIAIPMLTSLMGVPTPTSLPAAFLTLPTIGAVLSGALAGDHISPVSEMTVMTATSSGSYPLDHAYTQFPYAAPPLFCTAVAFLISGFLNTTVGMWANILISLGTALALCFALLYLLDKTKKTKKTKA